MTLLSEVPTEAKAAMRELYSFAGTQGFQRYLCLIRLPAPDALPLQLILTNYPGAWLSSYELNRYVEIDPVVRKMLASPQPFAWHVLARNSEAEKSFFRAAAEHGLKDGITIPLHAPDGCSVILVLAQDEALDHQAAHSAMAKAYLFLSAKFEALRALAQPNTQVAARPLTDRQREVLTLSLHGRSIADIAKCLRLHRRTVEDTLRSTTMKLGARNRSHAIILALTSGQLQLVSFPSTLEAPTRLYMD